MMNLPKGWTACEVGSVAEINPRKPKAAPDELVSFVGMADVSEDMRLVHHSPRPYATVANGFTGFEDNDILVAKITPCFENGKGALVTDLTNGKGFGSTEFHVVRAQDESTRQLLFHHFSTHEFRVRGEANMTGSAGQKRIPSSFISEYVVPMPPKAEREKIATILGACDRALEGTALLLEKQEKLKAGLAHTLFLGNTAPEVKLEEVLTKKKGKKVVLNTVGLGAPYIGAASLTGQYTQYTESVDAAFCSETDVLVLWDGENAGLTATGLKGVLSTTMVALIPGPRLDNYFLHYALQFNNEKIRALRTGSGIPHMPSSFLSSYKIKLPSLTEQRRIGGVLRACDKEIKLLRKQHELLRLQKKGLMQRLLTGQSFTH